MLTLRYWCVLQRIHHSRIRMGVARGRGTHHLTRRWILHRGRSRVVGVIEHGGHTRVTLRHLAHQLCKMWYHYVIPLRHMYNIDCVRCAPVPHLGQFCWAWKQGPRSLLYQKTVMIAKMQSLCETWEGKALYILLTVFELLDGSTLSCGCVAWLMLVEDWC